MLSVDQLLRLIAVPAILLAALVASQISGAGPSHAAQSQMSVE
jgi:hypothetical protein